MTVAVACSQCGQRFGAAPHLFGQRVSCPSCGGVIDVPHAAPSGPAVAPPMYPQHAVGQPPRHGQFVPAQASSTGESMNRGVLIACIAGGGIVIVLLAAIVVSSIMNGSRSGTEIAEAGATDTPETALRTPPPPAQDTSEETADSLASQSPEGRTARKAVAPAIPAAPRDNAPPISSESNNRDDEAASTTPPTPGGQLAAELRASPLEVQVWNESTIPGARKTPFGRPPEAAPLIAVIEAVRDGDREKFLRAHGFARLRDSDSMEQIAQTYADQYGAGWQVSDFEFSFLGTSERGVVATRFQGQMLQGRIFVANQGGRWLIIGAE